MSAYTPLISARAYARKDELGGGYRAVAYNPATKERRESDVLPSMSAARNQAKSLALEMMGGRDVWDRVRPGYGRNNPLRWTCNYYGPY